MGNQTRLLGQALETDLNQLHTWYAADGTAEMWQAGTRAEHRGGRWQAMQSLPDFAGLLRGSGRAVAFDAKSKVAGGSYTHPKDRKHQLQHLWRVHQAGGVAFILLVVGNAAGWMILPRPEWEWGEGRSVKLAPSPLVVSVPAYRRAAGAYFPDWVSVCQRVQELRAA